MFNTLLWPKKKYFIALFTPTLELLKSSVLDEYMASYYSLFTLSDLGETIFCCMCVKSSAFIYIFIDKISENIIFTQFIF